MAKRVRASIGRKPISCRLMACRRGFSSNHAYGVACPLHRSFPEQRHPALTQANPGPPKKGSSMSIRVAIRHHTRYIYDRPVQLFPHIFRLRPAVHCRTPIEAYSLNIKPEKHFINWQQDPFGNFLGRVVFLEPAEFLDINVEVIANLKVINPFDFFLEDSAKHYP